MSRFNLSYLLICIYIACVTKASSVQSTDPAPQDFVDLMNMMHVADHEWKVATETYYYGQVKLEDLDNSKLDTQAELYNLHETYSSLTSELADIENAITSLTNALAGAEAEMQNNHETLDELNSAKTVIEDEYAFTPCDSTSCGVFQRRGTCNPVTGACECSYPWTGDSCDAKSGCDSNNERRLLVLGQTIYAPGISCSPECAELPRAGQYEYLMTLVNFEIQRVTRLNDDLTVTIGSIQSSLSSSESTRENLILSTHDVEAEIAYTETLMDSLQQALDDSQTNLNVYQQSKAQAASNKAMYTMLFQTACATACSTEVWPSTEDRFACYDSDYGCGDGWGEP